MRRRLPIQFRGLLARAVEIAGHQAQQADMVPGIRVQPVHALIRHDRHGRESHRFRAVAALVRRHDAIEQPVRGLARRHRRQVGRLPGALSGHGDVGRRLAPVPGRIGREPAGQKRRAEADGRRHEHDQRDLLPTPLPTGGPAANRRAAVRAEVRRRLKPCVAGCASGRLLRLRHRYSFVNGTAAGPMG